MQRMCSSKNWTLLFHLSHTASFSSSCLTVPCANPELPTPHKDPFSMYFSGTDTEQRKEASQAINIKKLHATTLKSAVIFFMSEANEDLHWSVFVSASMFSGKQDLSEQLDVHKQRWSVLSEEPALGVTSWGTAPWFSQLWWQAEPGFIIHLQTYMSQCWIFSYISPAPSFLLGRMWLILHYS